jgi:hypothetical protein
VSPETACSWLHQVTEDPASNARIAFLVDSAKKRGDMQSGCVDVERWLLAREGLDVLGSQRMAALGDAALALTCEEIGSFVQDDPSTRGMLDAAGVRFREFAKIVTTRRFCAGVYHWEECGLRRSWLLKVPLSDWPPFARMLLKTGLGPLMFPHLNPRRPSRRLEEPGLSRSLEVLAESMARRPYLRGFAAASWLRSPETHRVSPHLGAVNAPIVAHGGFVTTVGAASADSGVFACSEARKRLHEAGAFTPTIGLALWPREDMLRWWHSRPPVAPAEAARPTARPDP